jgi:hypothetical protein
MEIKKLLFSLSWIFITLIAFGMGVIFYWSFAPYTVITMNNQNSLPVDKQIYNEGDRIYYTLDYCKYIDIPGALYRTITDGISVNYEDIQSNLEMGCHKIQRGDLTIPDFLPSGIYHIASTSEWKVNPIRTVIMNYRTVDFKIERHSEVNEIMQEQLDKNSVNIQNLEDVNTLEGR